MDIIKLKIVTDTDIISILGRIISESPLKIKFSSNYSDLLTNAIMLNVQKYEKNNILEAEVLFIDIEENNIHLFKINSDYISTDERNFHRIDYKGFYNVLTINDTNRMEIERLFTHKSETIKSAFANKIRQLLVNESRSTCFVLP